jgi:hypothetical protein
VLALALVLLGCTGSEETSWEQYNATDNSVTVQVGVEETLPAVSVTLTSNTGAVDIGTGTVDPGGGPIGTIHTVQVQVLDDYKDDIDRVSVRMDSGDRGEDEVDLEKDSTGSGYWVTQVQSVGESGEVRDDTFTFRLWREADTDGGE